MGSVHHLRLNRTRGQKLSAPPSHLSTTSLWSRLLSTLASLEKGAPNVKRDPRIYRNWSAAYSTIMAPVVMYTDSEDFARHFLTVRRHLLNVTKVVHVNRSEIWSFGLRDRIAAIYAGVYPRHWPNTVYPDYTCLTHAKFDFVLDTLSEGYFASRHVVWMDVGYLRQVRKVTAAQYVVLPPPEFDSKRVWCGEVYKPNFRLPWKGIFRGNTNWVAGGFFLATRDVMRTCAEQYRRAVTSFLQLHENQVMNNYDCCGAPDKKAA